MTQSDDPIEIEVKLGVSEPAVVETLLESPPSSGIAGFVPAGPPRPTVSVDRYLDTAAPSGALRARGIRARTREEGGSFVLTVKSEAERSGDVHSRIELEGPAGPTADPTAWPDSVARTRLLEAIAGAPLLQVAALRQRRLKRRFRRGATEVEMSLDAMEALDGDAVVAQRHELEAELVGGDADALHELAAAIRLLPGVGDALGSKLRFAQEAVQGSERARSRDVNEPPTDG